MSLLLLFNNNNIIIIITKIIMLITKAIMTTVTITRQVLGRPVCDRGAIPRTLVQSNVVRSTLIRDRLSVALYATEERSPELWSNNEANWMVSNNAKLDRRTKQHTQFGVSASNGSRDMARTKSWQKKKIK